MRFRAETTPGLQSCLIYLLFKSAIKINPACIRPCSAFFLCCYPVDQMSPPPLYTCSSENVAHKMNLSDDPHQGNSLCNGGYTMYCSIFPSPHFPSVPWHSELMLFSSFFFGDFFSSLVKFRLTSTCFRCINFTRVDSSCFTSHPPKCLRCIWVDVKLLLFGCDFA